MLTQMKYAASFYASDPSAGPGPYDDDGDRRPYSVVGPDDSDGPCDEMPTENGREN